MSRFQPGFAVVFAVAVVAACSSEEERPPVLAAGGGANTPCGRLKGVCAVSASACTAGFASGGSSVGCPGEGAICCIPAPDAGRDATIADATTVIDATPDVIDANVTDAAIDAAIDAPDAD